jgi:hypothetical protein
MQSAHNSSCQVFISKKKMKYVILILYSMQKMHLPNWHLICMSKGCPQGGRWAVRRGRPGAGPVAVGIAVRPVRVGSGSTRPAWWRPGGGSGVLPTTRSKWLLRVGSRVAAGQAMRAGGRGAGGAAAGEKATHEKWRATT